MFSIVLKQLELASYLAHYITKCPLPDKEFHGKKPALVLFFSSDVKCNTSSKIRFSPSQKSPTKRHLNSDAKMATCNSKL